MTARKRDHLKLLSGTARPDRVAPATPVLPAIEGVPSPPDWLPNAFAAQEWRRLAPVLVVNRLLHEGNIGAFGQLCSIHGRLVQTWTAGETPTAALITVYRKLSNDLGLTSMALSPPATKPNRFLTNFGKRK